MKNEVKADSNERVEQEEAESQPTPSGVKDDNDENDAMTSSAPAIVSQDDESDMTAARPSKNKKTNKKEQKTSSTSANNASRPPIVLLKCTVCQKEFESRNKLYQHITSEGHTANKIEVTAATAAVALDAGLDLDGQPLSHNAIKKNKRLAKLANKK